MTSEEPREASVLRKNLQYTMSVLFKVEGKVVLELTSGFSSVGDIGDFDKCSLAEVVEKKV